VQARFALDPDQVALHRRHCCLEDASMPIVVYWMEQAGTPSHRGFGDAELLEALKLAEQLRACGERHVTISSEPANAVGKPGVDAVEGGRLPGGEAYEFNKRHRGAGPRSPR
jgi:hypothetical protein